MSRLVEEAVASFSRWRQLNEGAEPPPVKVFLNNGDEYLFNGLAVAPATSPDTVAIASSGITLPVLVVRDSDIAKFKIGHTMPARFGFQTPEQGS